MFMKRVFCTISCKSEVIVIDISDFRKELTLLLNPYLTFYCMFNAATPRLNKDECNQAVAMLLAGATQQEVVTAFGVHQSTVQRLNLRLHHLGSTDDRPRTGCPRVTTPRQNHHVRLQHLRNRFRNAVESAATFAGRGNQRISAQTVRNRLRGA